MHERDRDSNGFVVNDVLVGPEPRTSNGRNSEAEVGTAKERQYAATIAVPGSVRADPV